MATSNIIPSYLTSGSYEAANPFDVIVDANKYYTLEAIRSVSEMQGNNEDVYTKVFQPAGIAQTDYQVYLNALNAVAGAGIVVLVGNDGSRVYVPTTYLKTFPLKDGVSYERICVIVDMGACPPATADALTDLQTHFKNYTQANFGLIPTIKIGTMPTIGYFTAEQAGVFEATRKNAITNAKNDVLTVAQLTKDKAALEVYNAQLEAQIITLTKQLTDLQNQQSTTTTTPTTGS